MTKSEEILGWKLIKLEKLKWFRIDNRDDFEKLTTQVKKLIDDGWPFEFSDDMKKIRRITTMD